MLLPGVDTLKPVDDERDDVDVVCIRSIAIPLLARTEPVWTLAIGLQGIQVAPVTAGG